MHLYSLYTLIGPLLPLAPLSSKKSKPLGRGGQTHRKPTFSHLSEAFQADRRPSIATRVEAIPTRVKAIATRLEATAIRLELEAIAFELEAFRLEAIALRTPTLPFALFALAGPPARSRDAPRAAPVRYRWRHIPRSMS